MVDVGFAPTTQKTHGLPTTPFVKVLVGYLVRLTTYKWLTNSLPKLSLIIYSSLPIGGGVSRPWKGALVSHTILKKNVTGTSVQSNHHLNSICKGNCCCTHRGNVINSSSRSTCTCCGASIATSILTYLSYRHQHRHQLSHVPVLSSHHLSTHCQSLPFVLLPTKCNSSGERDFKRSA